MAVIYDSAAAYIEDCVALEEKVTRIDAVIDALMTTALKAAGNDNIDEYWLDDGQTKIKTIYRGADALMSSIRSFEQLRQMYLNRLNGHVVRLVDSKSLRR